MVVDVLLCRELLFVVWAAFCQRCALQTPPQSTQAVLSRCVPQTVFKYSEFSRLSAVTTGRIKVSRKVGHTALCLLSGHGGLQSSALLWSQSHQQLLFCWFGSFQTFFMWLYDFILPKEKQNHWCVNKDRTNFITIGRAIVMCVCLLLSWLFNTF